MEFQTSKAEGELREAIVKTIAFFDLFDYPLTAHEIWQFVGVKCELIEVISGLTALKEADAPVDEKNGFYFLAGQEEIINARKKRYNYSDKKFKRAILITKLFNFIPWIKMTAVSNIIGTHNLKKESDIDLFIITENNRVWITRFFCAGLMKLLGLRPREEKEKDKICLNFYISEEAMDLRELMLDNLNQGEEKKDIYFIYWLAGLVPIYNKNKTWEEFIGANNWPKEYLPNWLARGLNYRRNTGRGFSKFYRETVDLFLGGLEKRMKKLQLKIMPVKMIGDMSQGANVVINNKVIKLHTKDRREEYREKFNKKVYEIFRKNN